ncbi:Por secretion system C-terminal sorting domain-containing protein [Neolewinella agarilytica]|uniref:Por secretion system C-terminal sorting domain-containing protein n=1 Tax=Neolewinella agarilytica TaxID=478744 RepID=A0A1H9FJW6_9BACT|nr:Por secretion system C-terminal sorting domain-containing protein [Neolewinella agarilytica]
MTVTDANGCTETAEGTVNEPTDVTATVADADVLCNGDADGTLTVVADGGTADYTYEWSNGQTDATATGLVAGTYTVTVTDANGCTETAEGTVNEPTALTLTGTTVEVGCNGDASGSIDITVGGGTPDYTYAWSNGAATEDLSDLTAGTYSVTVTDANGCTIDETFEIEESSDIEATVADTDVLCNGDADGTLTVVANGGTAPYTYAWSNGQTDATATGLVAGTYTVTVTDANGCTETAEGTVNEPTDVTATVADTDVLCNGDADGTLTVVADGGTAPYTYAWSNGQTDATATGLVADTYTVTVTDANGCTETAEGTVNEPTDVTATVADADVLCNGDADGTLTVVADGGTAGYTYEWSNGQTDATATGLVAGTYTVTVTDANGCTEIAEGTVNEPTALTLEGESTDVGCNGDATGTITLTVGGGTAPYTYAWAAATGVVVDAMNQTGLAAGDYAVTVTDANNCTIEGTYTVTETDDLSAEIADASVDCNGDADGELTVTVEGGTAPYTYLWSNGQTEATATGLSAGENGVTVTDANGCETTATGTVTEPEVLEGSIATAILDCNGDEDGVLTVTPTGGTAPYTYLWSNGDTGATATGFAAGEHDVTITDANGCERIATGTVFEPEVLLGSVIPTPASELDCNGDADGELTVTVTGGTEPYTYLWSDDQTTATATGLVAGDYTVTITDLNGCVTSTGGTITEPDALTLTTDQTDIGCSGDAAGSITLMVGGGTEPYTYEWAAADGIDTEAMNQTNLTAGTYSVTVTDANDCTISETVTIDEASTLDASIVGTTVDCNGDTDGQLTAVVTGGTEPYTYAWSSGDTEATATGLAAGTYTLTVTDANECEVITSGTVTEPDPIAIEVAGIVELECNEIDGAAIDITITGGTEPYTFTWTGTGVDVDAEDQTDLEAGAYSVVVTDAFNCSASESFNIAPAPALIASIADDIVCITATDAGTLTAVVESGTGPYTYLWDNGESTPTVTDLAIGVHTVTITDEATGCATVVSGSVLGQAAACSELGNFVWNDLNGDGLQTVGEPGVEGVVVNLKDEDGNIIASTTTDENGFYNFSLLAPGTYSVQFVLPDGFEWAPLGAIAGANEASDSDADPAMNGMTETVDLEAGESYLDLDAGIMFIPVCDLTATVTAEPVCDDNGTGADPADDFYTVTILVDGVSPSGRWRSSIQGTNGNPVEGVVGTPYTFRLPAVQAGDEVEDITIFFSDLEDATCEVSVDHTPTETCSDDCLLQAALTSSPQCDDNGTPTDPSDDFFTVGVTVEGLNGNGSGWTIYNADNEVVGTGIFGEENPSVGPFTLSDLNDNDQLIMTVRDNNNANCDYVLRPTINTAILPCSDECLISLELDETYCDDNGTPTIGSDDVWYAVVRINGENVDFWTSDAPGGGGQNRIDRLVTFGPFTGGDKMITIMSVNNDTECEAEIFLPAPEMPCSDECEIDGQILDIFCDDLGNNDPTDDVIRILVTANRVGENNGDEGWLVREGTDRLDPVIGVGPIFGNTYPFTLAAYDANGNRRTETNLRIEDASGFYCRVDTLIAIPACDPIAECDIVAELSNETLCNDNDTPSNDSDDFFTVDLAVTGDNTGAGWTATVNGETVATGTYGAAPQTLRFLTGTADLTLVVTDTENGNCTDVLTIEVPPSCPTDEECDLAVAIIETICNDNGTPFNGDDDTYDIMVLATGLEGGYTIDLTYNTGTITARGVFGEPGRFGPIPADSDVAGTVVPDDVNCTSIGALFGTATGPCTACRLDVVELSNVCDDNGTADPSDDTFTVCVQITSEEGGAGYMVENVPVEGTVVGLFDENGVAERCFTFPSAGGDVTLRFMDLGDDRCFDDITFEASTCSPCEITGVLSNQSECDANNTPTDGSDDFFTVDLTVTGFNTGASWGAFVDGERIAAGSYGQTQELEFLTGTGTFTIEVMDVDNGDCIDVLTITAPESCPTFEPCDITAVLSNQSECNDNDTPRDGSDDFFTVDVMVTGVGTGPNWIAYVDGERVGAGSYGEMQRLPFAPGTGTFTIEVRDAADGNCIDVLTVTAPETCVTTTPCDITAELSNQTGCDNNGTEEDGSDDFFTVELTVTGVGTGAGWTTTVDGQTITGDYGVTEVLTISTGLGTFNIEVMDVDSVSCIAVLPITAPESCVTGTVGIDCPISNHYCPILEENIMLFPMDHFDCVANFDVAIPVVTNVCSENWTLLTQIVDLDGTVIATIENDEADRNVTLEAGDYFIRYTVTDDCGNTGTQDCRIRVADTQEPAAICISDINVSVGGYGLARIYSQMIDLGSYDNCGLDSIQVRRLILVDPVTMDTLDTPVWSAWGPYATVDCYDAGSIVTMQLRVMDFGGNTNICTTNVSVVDNTLPYCTGLEDLFLSCTEVSADFNPNDTLSLQTLFGVPDVIDNCAATAIELDPIVNIDECSGAGQVTRRWLAVDRVGNVSAQEFFQVITITRDMGFTLVIPKDTLTDCIEVAQGFEVLGESCADLSVTFRDTTVEATAADGEACLVIERTYTVINNCTFDPATDEILEISRDENCNGEEGESVLYAIVTGDSTFIDIDTDFNNALPVAGTRGDECDGETNRTGYFRSVANTGAWTYTQRISIFDDTRPTLVFEAPEAFCATEDGDCDAMINIPITVSDECTAVGSNWLVLVDLGRDGSPEMRLPSELAVQGEFPNYFIEAALPIGEHTLMLRYVDGCGNSTAASVPFEVIDCSIPDPTCYSGLIADLEELETPVTDEDGNLVEVGVLVDAGRLASCNIEDCSGALRFSVNRVGDTVNIDSTTVLLTCEDRYRVDLEVYMWDGAFNPNAVQPDGTIGGPNWKMCVVEVLVQDPKELCDDCNADGSLTLGGNVTTFRGVVLPNVEVELNGDNDGFELTNDDGKYAFSGVDAGNYVIKPYKEDDATNGVSTIDELILQRHLLGIAPITDPYVFMAADLNGSGTITVLDRLLLRNIILGNTEVLPGNESWRFVPARYMEQAGAELASMMDAPREIKLSEVEACNLGHDFVAIKLGDLNNSVFIENTIGHILNGTRGRSSNETHPLEIEEHRLRGGDLFDLPVRSGDLQRLEGMQFTLAFDQDAVQIEEVVPGLLATDQMGLSQVERGLVSASWTRENDSVQDEEILFTVRVRVLSNVSVSEVVSFEDNPTFTEAYLRETEELMGLYLNFPQGTEAPFNPEIVTGEEAGFELEAALEQNFPNPFITETTISFHLPEAGEATLSIYDLNGRVLKDFSGEFNQGVNSVKLNARDYAAGTLVYTLNYKGQLLTRTMIRH